MFIKLELYLIIFKYTSLLNLPENINYCYIYMQTIFIILVTIISMNNLDIYNKIIIIINKYNYKIIIIINKDASIKIYLKMYLNIQQTFIHN